MKAKTRVRMLDFLLVDIKRNSYYEVCHNHDYYEFLCITKGKVSNRINDEVQVLKEKTLVLVRPEDIHIVAKEEDYEGEVEYFNLPVPADFMENRFSECDEFQKIVHSGALPPTVKLSSNETAILYEKAKSISVLPMSDKKKFLYFNLVHELCSYVLENKLVGQGKVSKWFSDILSMIERTSPEELDYESILESSGVTAKTLWQTFKKHLGMTPTEYLRKRKSEAAYDLIVNTELSFTEIAIQLNYGSYAQFYRDFMEIHGISPRQARGNSAKN